MEIYVHKMTINLSFYEELMSLDRPAKYHR
jgi:hypothetical protein